MKLKIFSLAMALAACCVSVSCSDDDEPVSAKAVLASASSLTFEAASAAPQSIIITSDAEWYSEAPQNVTVTPATGHAGQTEVTISVADNYVDGVMDNPKTYEVLFRGNTKKSIATVKVYQLGDTYRGVADYQIFELVTAPENTVLQMSGLTIASKLKEGAVATSGDEFVYVAGNPEGVEVGATGIVKGTKKSNIAGIPYVVSDRFDAEGTGSYTPGTPEDFTATIDSYTSDVVKYVTVSGQLAGTKLTVDGKNGSVEILDIPADLNISEYSYHTVQLTGYYGGKSGATHLLYLTEIKDLGLAEVVYFSDDFEWLEPWSSQTPAGQTVESDSSNSKAQQMGTNKVNDVSTFEAVKAKGYEFIGTHDPAKAERELYKQTYLQRNYIKFGLTGYQSGITLPKVSTIPESANVVISFDWCSMRQGGDERGKFDATKLVVIVTNGTDQKVYDVPEHNLQEGESYRWIPVSIDLAGAKFDANTTITIRNCDEQWGVAAAYRYFIDNIKLSEK